MEAFALFFSFAEADRNKKPLPLLSALFQNVLKEISIMPVLVVFHSSPALQTK